MNIRTAVLIGLIRVMAKGMIVVAKDARWRCGHGSAPTAGSPAFALREELIGVDGAVTVGVYVVLQHHPTVTLPPVAISRGEITDVGL